MDITTKKVTIKNRETCKEETKTVNLKLSGGFDRKHVTNGMNEKKVYEFSRNQTKDKITRLANIDVIVNYLKDNTFSITTFPDKQDNTKMRFSIVINTSEGNNAMTYSRENDGEVKRCSSITVHGNIEGNDYTIDHLHSSATTGEIIYNEANYQDDLNREEQIRLIEQAERAEQNRTAERAENYNQNQAQLREELLRSRQEEIDALMNGVEGYEFTKEEAIEELMIRYR